MKQLFLKGKTNIDHSANALLRIVSKLQSLFFNILFNDIFADYVSESNEAVEMRGIKRELINASYSRRFGLFLAMVFIPGLLLMGQGFLHAEGKQIVDGAGENVILRGIGTGNWMIQEGYMMQSTGVAGTQHEFRENLINTIGEAKTDSFYNVWLDNHFTRTDVDSLASWGFNSVRVAMHYKWFTLPIEDESVQGEQTWLDKGFELLDSLLDWCGDNEMYLILDLHGAPGGQGTNADISDYDASKPSLWESQDNKDKTVALWQKLAERYSDEPWIGGYDLINETNWTFPEGNNSQMRSLFTQITDSIRTVDQNHIIIIEGNWFANDFSGLTPPWDDNMVYSFHKYWSFNRLNSLNWVTSLRNSHKVPIWLGESGENSNTWYRNLVALCESQNIGWSWWPVKKGGINNPLKVHVNDMYLQMIDNWKGKGVVLSEEEAFQAVLEFADMHRIENCDFQRDVVDALIRQPHSTDAVQYRSHSIGDTIFATDYDLGRNAYAYFDMDTADYHLDMEGEYISWNKGWVYRNDGVDIQACEDTLLTNGYNVGWTETDEWLGYTFESDSAIAYNLVIRSASEGSGARIHVEVNGVNATGSVNLPNTGGWQSWSSTNIGEIIMPRGEVQLRIVFERGGSNLNFFALNNPHSVSDIPFRYVAAETAVLQNKIYISLNKAITSPKIFNGSEFSLLVGGNPVDIQHVDVSESDPRILVISTSASMLFNQQVRISYSGSSIMHGDQPMSTFDSELVTNKLARHYKIPAKIQAEYFYYNKGLELETCSDLGGGFNTGFANVGDCLDYVILVEESGEYALDFRVATERSNARLDIQTDVGAGFETLHSMSFARTGGWQSWTTQSTRVQLDSGKFVLRLRVSGEEHNLNWFQFNSTVGISENDENVTFRMYPNPAMEQVTIEMDSSESSMVRLEVLDSMGRMMYTRTSNTGAWVVDTSSWPAGLYFVCWGTGISGQVLKLVVN